MDTIKRMVAELGKIPPPEETGQFRLYQSAERIVVRGLALMAKSAMAQASDGEVDPEVELQVEQALTALGLPSESLGRAIDGIRQRVISYRWLQELADRGLGKELHEAKAIEAAVQDEFDHHTAVLGSRVDLRRRIAGLPKALRDELREIDPKLVGSVEYKLTRGQIAPIAL